MSESVTSDVCVCAAARKGTKCADAIIAGLLDGMPLGDTDRVYWVDVVPNECLESIYKIRTKQ